MYIYIYICIERDYKSISYICIHICMCIYIYIYIYISGPAVARPPPHAQGWTPATNALSGGAQTTTIYSILRPISVLTLWISEGLTRA